MNRKNIKRPESLQLESLAIQLAESSSLELPTDSSHDNYNVAFKNSFSLKKSQKGRDGSTPTKPMLPVSPKLADKKFYEWTRIEVHNWLVNLPDLNRISKAQEVARSFLDHNISGDVLPYLTLSYLADMEIQELRVRLILRKNIEALLVQYAEKTDDPVFEDMIRTANIMPNTPFLLVLGEEYTLSLAEKVLSGLADQIAASYPRTLPSLPPLPVDPLEELKKLAASVLRLKEDVTPLVKHYKNARAAQTPDTGVFLGTVSPAPLALPGTLPMEEIRKPSDKTLVNPFKEKKEHASPVESEAPSHTRSMSNLSIKATSLTINKGPINSTPLPTNGSAYQTAQSALQTPNLTTQSLHPTLSHQQLNSSFLAPSPFGSFIGSGQGVMKSEPLKQLKAKYDDPCYKVLQKAMIKHKINNVDWRNYVLVICYGDKERILGPEEKPVKVFKELQDKGQHPSFMIRQLEGASPGDSQLEVENPH